MRACATIISILVVAYPASARNNSLLSVAPDGRFLLVANSDNGTVSLIDTAARKTVREIPVGKKPESVAWIGNGPRAVATDYLRDQVVVFDAMKGVVLARIDCADEPYGVVVDKAGKFAYVTNDYPGLVSKIDLEKLAVSRTMPVGRFVRGIALTPDEKRLLVTEYYSGVLVAIDRESGAVVDRWQGSRSDNLARQVAVHPTLPYAYVPHIRSRIQRARGAGSIFPYLSVIDLVPPDSSDERRHVVSLDAYIGNHVTCNPWETAVSPDGKRNYIIYAGTNEMNVSEILDDHYRHVEPVTNMIAVGNNPRALAVAPDSKTVYVYNFLDGVVTFFGADPFRKLADVKVCESALKPSVHRGKVLFNTALAPMTSRRWIACSSCHPDGDHDGRTWQNPEGLRRTTHFFGMKRTHPIHWSADRDEAQDFEHTIRGPLMQGRGLIAGPVADALAAPNAKRSADLDALADYCNFFEHTLSPHAAGPGKLTPAAERGRTLFFSKETDCATCHSGPDYTDSSLEKPFKLHDVGTGTDDPSEKMGPKYDTPTLLRAYRATEYLHHGKAKTLLEVFSKFNPQDKHGKTSHLSEAQLDDLVAFLKSLPYEPPGK